MAQREMERGEGTKKYEEKGKEKSGTEEERRERSACLLHLYVRWRT